MHLFYKSRGEGYPVLLLHGLFGTGDNLGMIARALSEKFQVISVDLRNHGRSPHSPVMDYPNMARDVLALTEALGITSCHVLGHSMGGKVAMQLTLDQPTLIDKLIVADIAPITYPPHHGDIFAGLQRLVAQPITSREQADRLLAETITDVGTRQFLMTNLTRKGNEGLELRLNLEALMANQAEICAEIEGPTSNVPSLFIKGENSSYIGDAASLTIARLFPNSKLVTIENAGHWLHAEQPEVFNREVLAFLT